MRILVRLGITAIVSGGSGAVFWWVLQFGADIDPGIASASAAALATMIAGLGAVWAGQPADDSTHKPKLRAVPNTGTLKGVSSFFTDRTEEWADIKARVRRAKVGRQTRAAFMIYGMPGVGKSEFAQYAAHKFVAMFSRYARRAGLEMLPRQVELHGYEDLKRTDPKNALRALLDPSGANPRLFAMGLDDLKSEWRKYLHDKFLILLLDNADNEDQVLPFLPGGSSFILIVTGRRMVDGLIGAGVSPCLLDVLDAGGAVQMIKKIAGWSLKKGDQEAIEEVAQICGRHPLAITLAVARLAWKPGVSFANKSMQLKEVPNQLLAIDAHANRRSDGVVRSFDYSYAQLSDSAKLVLRRMGLAPVPTINVETAIVLANMPADMIAASLNELADEVLIREKQDGGYEMHDLIRRYAQALAARDDPDNDAAVNRLLAYYWGAAAYADSIFTRQPPSQDIEPPVPAVQHAFPDRSSVSAWARAELPNLLACTDYASRDGGGDRHQQKIWIVLFASALAGILRNEGQWLRSIDLQTQAIEAGGQLNMPLVVANSLSERALLYRLVSELESAVTDLERAIVIYREIGGATGETGEAYALNTYGVVLDQLHDRLGGRQRLSASLDICRRIHNPLGEANVLHDEGMAEFFAGNFDIAVQLLGQSLEIYREVDQPLGMAHACNNLARAQRRVGAESAAAENLKSARTLYRDLGNRLGEINVLIELGAVLRQRDRRQAVKILNDAIRLSADIGSHFGQVNALDELGKLYMANGKKRTALDIWARALMVAREHGLAREEAKLVDNVEHARLPTPTRPVLGSLRALPSAERPATG